MGWLAGLEPATSRVTIARSGQLSYSHQRRMVPTVSNRTDGISLTGGVPYQLGYVGGDELDVRAGVSPAWTGFADRCIDALPPHN